MTSFNILELTGEQIRAARALSRIEQAELARLAGLSIETIKRLERIRGPVEANTRTLRAIQEAFATLGVRFSGDQTGRIGVARDAQPRTGIGSDPRSDLEAESPVHRLIYHSRIRRFGQQNLRSTLAHIHREAETLHANLDLTGVLFAREGRLLQGLEGDKDLVHTAFGEISSRREHEDLYLVDDGPARKRSYAGFTFCCGLFDTDRNPVETRDLAFNQLTPLSAAGLLDQAYALQQELPRSRRGSPSLCALAETCLDSICSSRQRPAASGIAPQAVF